jgi:hypothetical protein
MRVSSSALSSGQMLHDLHLSGQTRNKNSSTHYVGLEELFKCGVCSQRMTHDAAGPPPSLLLGCDFAHVTCVGLASNMKVRNVTEFVRHDVWDCCILS